MAGGHVEVGGLDVAVDDARLVQQLEALGETPERLGDFARRNAPAGLHAVYAVAQGEAGHALQELHDDEEGLGRAADGLEVLHEGDETVVVELAEHLCLAYEPLRVLRAQKALDGDDHAVVDAARPEDDAEAALAHAAQELVAARRAYDLAKLHGAEGVAELEVGEVASRAFRGEAPLDDLLDVRERVDLVRLYLERPVHVHAGDARPALEVGHHRLLAEGAAG